MSDNTDQPWYKDGLHFTCQGCGRCCSGPGGFVWAEDDEVEALAAALKMDLDAFGKKYLRRVGGRVALIDGPNGDCIFLENGRCQVYEARPVQCRTFPWWPEIVRSSISWDYEKKRCPGIGQGTLHPLDTIRAGLKEHAGE